MGPRWDANSGFTMSMNLDYHVSYRIFGPGLTACRGIPEILLEVCQPTIVGRRTHLPGVPNSRVNVLFCVAGFRPGRRGPFVPAKGPKTSDAPSGLMRADGRQPEEGGPTRSAHTRPASDESVPPLAQTAGIGPWETNFSGTHMKGRGSFEMSELKVNQL